MSTVGAQQIVDMFHQRCGHRVILTNNNCTAIRDFLEYNYGLVLSAEPLKDDELFEVRIDKKVPKSNIRTRPVYRCLGSVKILFTMFILEVFHVSTYHNDPAFMLHTVIQRSVIESTCKPAFFICCFYQLVINFQLFIHFIIA